MLSERVLYERQNHLVCDDETSGLKISSDKFRYQLILECKFYQDFSLKQGNMGSSWPLQFFGYLKLNYFMLMMHLLKQFAVFQSHLVGN